MSLNVSWGGWGTALTADHPLYSKLTDKQKTWLLPEDMFNSYSLPLLLMATGVNCVTPSSIPDIVARANIVYAHNIHNLLAWAGEPYQHSDYALSKLLEKYVGVSINTHYEPFRSWYTSLKTKTNEARGIKIAVKEYQAWNRSFCTENEPKVMADKRPKTKSVSQSGTATEA